MLDNLMNALGTPSLVKTVLDWEMETPGDPFTDIGWMCVQWWDPRDPPWDAPNLLLGFTGAEGYLTRQTFIERYERKTGFTFANPRFYRAFRRVQTRGGRRDVLRTLSRNEQQQSARRLHG